MCTRRTVGEDEDKGKVIPKTKEHQRLPANAKKLGKMQCYGLNVFLPNHVEIPTSNVMALEGRILER